MRDRSNSKSLVMNSILDISQVESLMFRKDWIYDSDSKITGQTYYYIPVSSD